MLILGPKWYISKFWAKIEISWKTENCYIHPIFNAWHQLEVLQKHNKECRERFGEINTHFNHLLRCHQVQLQKNLIKIFREIFKKKKKKWIWPKNDPFSSFGHNMSFPQRIGSVICLMNPNFKQKHNKSNKQIFR